jgi:hypothetical protein
MARYKMKDRFLFVDAYDFKDNKRKPDAIPFAHVLDQTNSPANKYLKLNDTAGFITRFIVFGVDTDLIPQILSSEFGGAAAEHQAEVDTVVAMLQDYLQKLPPVTQKKSYAGPESLGVDKLTGGYDLDFRVNWFPTGWIKG